MTKPIAHGPVLGTIADLARSKPQLVAENLLLRQSGRREVSLSPAPLRTGRATFTASGSSMSSRISFFLLYGLPLHFRVDLLVAVQVYDSQVVPCVCSPFAPWNLVMLLRFFHHSDCAFG